MNIEEYIKQGKTHFEDSIDHLRNELGKVRAGKASTKMLDGIIVDYYGHSYTY